MTAEPPATSFWLVATTRRCRAHQHDRVLVGVKARRFAPPPLREADGPDAGCAPGPRRSCPTARERSDRRASGTLEERSTAPMEETDRRRCCAPTSRSTSPKSPIHIPGIGDPLHRNTHQWGMRRSEVSVLRWADIDDAAGAIGEDGEAAVPGGEPEPPASKRVTAHFEPRPGLASELTSRAASTTDVMLAGNWKTSWMVAHLCAASLLPVLEVGALSILIHPRIRLLVVRLDAIGCGENRDSVGRWSSPPRRRSASRSSAGGPHRRASGAHGGCSVSPPWSWSRIALSRALTALPSHGPRPGQLLN